MVNRNNRSNITGGKSFHWRVYKHGRRNLENHFFTVLKVADYVSAVISKSDFWRHNHTLVLESNKTVRTSCLAFKIIHHNLKSEWPYSWLNRQTNLRRHIHTGENGNRRVSYNKETKKEYIKKYRLFLTRDENIKHHGWNCTEQQVSGVLATKPTPSLRRATKVRRLNPITCTWQTFIYLSMINFNCNR